MFGKNFRTIANSADIENMSFTTEQLKQIRKIKKAFDKLRQLDEEEMTLTLQVGEVDKDTHCSDDPVAFQQLFIESDSGERVLITDDMVFTPDTEQQNIFDIVKGCLECKEEKASKNAK